MSPKRVFALGLLVCSLLNIGFGLSSTLPQFAFFWLLNGCFQGLAAPPCVKMITNWFDPKERGFWWSVWHASINVGGFLCPFFAGTLAGNLGWRYGMLGPGCLGLVTVVLCFLAMSDGPGAGNTKKTTKKVKPEPEAGVKRQKPARAFFCFLGGCTFSALLKGTPLFVLQLTQIGGLCQMDLKGNQKDNHQFPQER